MKRSLHTPCTDYSGFLQYILYDLAINVIDILHFFCYAYSPWWNYSYRLHQTTSPLLWLLIRPRFTSLTYWRYVARWKRWELSNCPSWQHFSMPPQFCPLSLISFHSVSTEWMRLLSTESIHLSTHLLPCYIYDMSASSWYEPYIITTSAILLARPNRIPSYLHILGWPRVESGLTRVGPGWVFSGKSY